MNFIFSSSFFQGREGTFGCWPDDGRLGFMGSRGPCWLILFYGIRIETVLFCSLSTGRQLTSQISSKLTKALMFFWGIYRIESSLNPSITFAQYSFLSFTKTILQLVPHPDAFYLRHSFGPFPNKHSNSKMIVLVYTKL